MVGLNQSSSEKFGIFVATEFLVVTVALSLMFAIGAAFKNLQVAQLFAPMLVILLSLFGFDACDRDVDKVRDWHDVGDCDLGCCCRR